MLNHYQVIVIGGGPAGLAASCTSAKNGAATLLIEREAKLGGILKQCIHDGFGVLRYQEKLSGPEYAEKEIETLKGLNITVSLLTFVTAIKKTKEGFILTLVTKEGIQEVSGERLILATGCRERTSKQVSIYGTNPAGVLSAGTAQYYINILGKMPTRRCVILGSGDIGMIMARRITLEGGKVLGVFEAKPTPSGLTRNIMQCLHDYDIPLYLSTTVTKVFGEERLEAVEISQVDEKMKPIPNTNKIIKCDALILSVGLIPENEIAEKIQVPLSNLTKGPIVDQTLQTMVPGVYSCGNALHVNDLADYVSESGEVAGLNAATSRVGSPEYVDLVIDEHFSYIVPEKLELNSSLKTILYFRSRAEYTNKTLHIYVNDVEVMKRKYQKLKPPEMERLVVDFSNYPNIKSIKLSLED
jgi:thioredoxin reductase